ncbi:unnamed protein product [Linum trigynum]|uniref:Uncharacterized protein n=1 Tax=Linum trigynum TaxID=586398 RepID=A0AAV2EPT9_9ROSI
MRLDSFSQVSALGPLSSALSPTAAPHVIAIEDPQPPPTSRTISFSRQSRCPLLPCLLIMLLPTAMSCFLIASNKDPQRHPTPSQSQLTSIG